MPNSLALLLAGVLSLFVGAVKGISQVVRLRRMSRDLSVLQKWSGKPLSAWKFEPHSSTAVSIHIVAILAMCAAAVILAIDPVEFYVAELVKNPTMRLLVWFSEIGSMVLIGYMTGVLVSYPVVRLFQTQADFAITDLGIVYGRTLLPWQWFSHFTLDPQTNLLRLYSSYIPDLPSLITKLPSRINLVDLETILLRSLPAEPSSNEKVWYRSRWALVPAMIVLSTPLIVAGWLSTFLPRTLGLFLEAAMVTILVSLGGRLISLYSFGVTTVKGDWHKNTPAE